MIKRKTMFRKILRWIKIAMGGISLTLGLVWSYYLMYTNMDMTDMRFFVTFWPQLIMMFFMMIGGTYLMRDLFK